MPDEKTENWDKKLLPLMKCLIGKKGLEQRQASEVDKMKVDFIRGKDFVDFMMKRDAVLKRHCQPILDEYTDGRPPADEEDVAKIGSALVAKGFLAKAVYRPLVEGADESGRRKKWPDRLVRKEGKVFEPTAYYIVLYEGSKAMQHLMLAGIITCIILGCLWPVWPPWARVAAWYVGFAFITLWICLEITRLSCFCGGWIVGVEFWIFPNFNDEYVSFLDSFKPFYSFERRRDGMMMLVTRLVIFAVVYLAIEEASKTHSIHDISDVIVNGYQDILTWGENKALMLEAGPTKMALPNLADLEKEEEEERIKEAGNLGGSFPRTASVAPDEVEEVRDDM